MKLFEPITIRGMTLRNRVVMPAMRVNMGPRTGRARAFYMERARGGVGAITIQPVFTDVLTSDEAWGKEGAVDEFIAALHPLCDVVHETGAKIGIQLAYFNRFPQGLSPSNARGELVAPSPRVEVEPTAPFVEAGTELRALTITEIETIIHNFGVAAGNSRRAGFDYVELHAAHSMLPCQFFSPLENKRNDRYGGDLVRRMQFGIECVATMRHAVGDNYPIFVRIGATDYRPGGLTIEDGAEYAHQLGKSGADVINVSLASRLGHIPTTDYPLGCFVDLAERVKQRVTVAVMAVGRIHRPELAETILAQGQADLIGIGRQLIADPLWVKKIAEGQTEDINPCLSCNNCYESISGGRLVCTVNPSAGQEMEYRITLTEKPKKVFVVGGGPGGMEAAWVSAERGHKVVLIEKKGELGGQLSMASCIPNKGILREFSEYLARQVKKAGAEIRLGKEATADYVEEAKPDVVIVATGASPFLPNILGVNSTNVASAWDVVSGVRETGKQVVIIGGELVACDVAEFLAERGKKVTMMRRGLKMVTKVTQSELRKELLDRLAAKGVNMLTGVKYREITDRGLTYKDSQGREGFIEANTIVIAVGATPNSSLASELEGRVSELYQVGDCVEARRIKEAIHEAASIARKI